VGQRQFLRLLLGATVIGVACLEYRSIWSVNAIWAAIDHVLQMVIAIAVADLRPPAELYCIKDITGDKEIWLMLARS